MIKMQIPNDFKIVEQLPPKEMVNKSFVEIKTISWKQMLLFFGRDL
jgi:hypothetical protein